MKMKFAAFLACLTFIIGIFVGASFNRWKQGSVVAEANSGTLKIRKVPTAPPGLNDGFAYRCEIWSNGVLFKATTLYHPDFAARNGKCAIITVSPSRPVFDIDGYRIECIDTPEEDTNWKLLAN